MPGVEVVSAGIKPGELDDAAVKVMAENGFKVKSRKGRSLKKLSNLDFNVVIALCRQSAGECPVLPGYPERVDWNLPDPAQGPAKGLSERLRSSE